MKKVLLIISSLFVSQLANAQYGKCFSPQLLHGTSGTPLQIVSANFNNDANADAVIANFTANNIDVNLNAFASGNFSPASYTTSSGPTTSAVGDIDNDGDVDIVVAGNSTNINVLKNNGSGAFTTYTTNTTTYANFAHSLLSDMNNDGNLDLVLSAQSGAIVTMLGNGFGNFITNTTKVLSGSGGRMVVYDFNTDGNKDVVVVQQSTNSINQLLGNGTGGFITITNTTTVGNMPIDIVCADLNYDGINDVAVANYNSNNLSVIYNNGSGGLLTTNTTVSFPSNYFPQTMATGDFNNDAKADVVIGFNVSGKLGVLLNDALGSFQSPIYFTPVGSPRGVVVGNYDAGTNLDFACVYQSTGQMQSWLNSLAPNVGISASSYTLCSGQSLTLNGTGANTYTWTNGVTNNVAFTPTVSNTYTVSGTSTITGCSNTSTVSITVAASPTVNLSSSASGTLCAGATATLFATGSPSVSYLWAHNNSTNSSAVVTAGTYSLQGTIGTCVVTKTISVFAYPSFSVSITPSSTVICTPGNVTLTATGANTYGWVRPTNMTAGGSSLVSADAGTYTLTGFVNGCSSSTTMSINSYAKPNVGIVSLPTNTTSTYYCSAQTITVTANGAPLYSWNNGNTSNSFTTSASGNYTVTGNNNGCTNSATIGITVLPTPTLTGVTNYSIGACASNSISLTASGANTYSWSTGTTGNQAAVKPTSNTTYTVTGFSGGLAGCKASMVYSVNVITVPNDYMVTDAFGAPITNTICAGGNVTVYLYQNGNNPIGSWDNADYGSSAVYYGVQPNQTYSVSFVDASSQCTSSLTFSLPVVNCSAGNNFLTVQSSTNTICAGQSATITASGALTYFLNGNPSSGNMIVTPTVSTTYTVSGKNSSGVTETTLVSITVITCTTTSINEEILHNGFFVYPNPAHDMVSIMLPNANESIVSVINALGEVVLKEKVYAESITLKIDNLTNGVYFIKLESEKGSSALKLIKQ